MTKYKGYQELSGKTWGDIKYSAQRRGLSFDDNLTIEYAWNLYLKQDKKCALSGLPIEIVRCSKTRNTASLDRIDSNFGYNRDNVQWLHKDVNNLKGSMSSKDTIELCRKIFFQDLKNRRPDWPEYFVNMAYVISTRSKDPSTKCGAVITDKNYRVISTGYNGNFQNIDDSLISWERPEKYTTVVHAEMNALIFAKVDLSGCYCFTTTIPCSNCCKHLIQAGISKFYYGKHPAKICDDKEEQIVRKLCNLKNVELIKIEI